MASQWEAELGKQIQYAGLPHPELEYRFYPARRWRFDLAWPEDHLAVEVEGGRWIRGRHNHPVGYHHDLEKYNQAVLEGWRVLRVDEDMIKDGSALTLIEQALGSGSSATITSGSQKKPPFSQQALNAYLRGELHPLGRSTTRRPESDYEQDLKRAEHLIPDERSHQ